MEIVRSKIIRLFPSKQQEELMRRHMGASRFIYNYMLDRQIERHEKGERYLSMFDMVRLLKPLKNDGVHGWLYEISNATLSRTCADLEAAYKNFMSGRKRFPRYKTLKCAKQVYPVSDMISDLWFSESFVNVPKIGKMSYKTNYNIPFGRKQKFVNPRIRYTANGKWLLTVGIRCESQASDMTSSSMGIDLGIKELAVVAYGDEKFVFDNKNKSKQIRNDRRRLEHLQRNLSRKYKTNGSYEETKNIQKTLSQIRRLYYHLTCTQKEYIHQITHKLISLKPNRVVMENLNISGMMKNHHLAKAIQQQCLYEFIRQMRYKCEQFEIPFLQVDTFYPSSKTCSCCGAIKRDLKLSDRTFVCLECGFTIDRDYNAARNLMMYNTHK